MKSITTTQLQVQPTTKVDSPFIQDLLLTGDGQVNDGVGKLTTIIVYNPLNLEAIIAAAEIKRHHPKRMIIPANHLLPTQHELDVHNTSFIWLGVKLGEDRLRFMKLQKCRHVYYSSQDAVAADETGYRATMIERACVDQDIRMTPRLLDIAYHASTFYDATGVKETRDVKTQNLVSVWASLRAALVTLNGDMDTGRRNMTAEAIYLEDVARAKRVINGDYRLEMSRDGTCNVRTLVTHFNDHLFILALRIIRLSHASFMNHWVCSNGTLLYTNLHKPQIEDEDKISPIFLN